MVLMLHAGILSLLPMPAMADDTKVTFPDANLEAAIRVTISKPSGYIYASDLSGLTDIDLSMKGIVNLSGLEYCTALTGLSLNNNQISDLTPLAGLTNLGHLNLEYNRINNLTPLAGLTKLTILNLPRNQLSDLTPLAGLANLLALNLGDNRISNLAPLAGLAKLTVLNLQNNLISNHAPLAGLANLLALNLQNNQISNPTLLVGLAKLTILNLQNNRISNLTPLAGLADLLALNLENNRISNLAPLTGLTKLTILNLKNNRISNLTPLVSNPGLGVADAVDLRENPLNRTSVDVHIPALKARGVTVLWDTAAPDIIPDPVILTGSEVSNMISTRPHSASTPSTIAHPTSIQLPNVYTSQAAISTTEVTPDSPVYVTATIANKGSANGNAVVKLIVNGEEEGRQSFAVASGSTIPVTFTIQKSQPGIYNVSVNNISAGSFRVSDNSTILYVSIAGLFLAFALGVILIYRRFTV
jgi:Leucine-rich repeat (LRR) protein